MTKSPPVRIDTVSDVVCPWCVRGYFQLAKPAAIPVSRLTCSGIHLN
jgi:predicted DsbA family dithiol-disulfide isomerase